MFFFDETVFDILRKNWDRPAARGLSAAMMIGVNQNTLKTRIAKGQATCIRKLEGRDRASVEFTCKHLVENLIADRLLLHGVGQFSSIAEQHSVISRLSNEVKNKVVDTPFLSNAVVCAQLDHNDKPQVIWLDDEKDFVSSTSDVTVVLPISKIVEDLGRKLSGVGSGNLLHPWQY